MTLDLENEEDISKLKEIGKIVSQTLKQMGEYVQAGITTKELDDIGRQLLLEQGANSAPELVYKFPGATCISINHAVAHGIPDDTVIKNGDMINIDVSAEKHGFFADTGASFIVPSANPEQKKVCQTTRKALKKAIQEVRAGRPLNIIGKTIEAEAQKNGLSIIRNLGSHGVGKGLHEEPKFIASYYNHADRRVLTKGMVITIEPFLSTGAKNVYVDKDGWTLRTQPHFYTAQYEHTLIVTEGDAIVVT